MSNDVNDPSSEPNGPESEAMRRRRILIGSQKDPDTYRPKRPRDWVPVEGEPEQEAAEQVPAAASAAPPAAVPPAPQPAAPAPAEPVRAEAAEPAPVVLPPPVLPLPMPPPQVLPPAPRVEQAPPAAEVRPAPEPRPGPAPEPRGGRGPESRGRPPRPRRREREADAGQNEESRAPLRPVHTVPLPNIRDRLSADLEEEIDQALGEASLEVLLAEGEGVSRQPTLEIDSQQTGRVVAIRRDDVFVELGGREQGVLPLRQMPQPPEIGTTLPVRIQRFNPEEGLYELSAANAPAVVADWGDLSEGMVVSAKVTGHNSGGLECEVNHIRGFIPVSQIAMYRVENLEEFVGQQFTCLVAEANEQRRNLVLSRRALLEREKEEAREKLMSSIEVGQIHEGVVRKLMDFGAFVDIGGVDGLLHISQLSWARVRHPSDVLQEGQAVRVRINKIDPVTGKLSLGYRDMLENPWTQAAQKYPPQSVVRATVTKIMEFGAFVEVEPGVEGLVHISELSPKRVWRATDVVTPGQEVEALVLSVDPDAQRMSLSIKAMSQSAEPEKKEETVPEAGPAPAAARNKPAAPLKGGLGSNTGGDRFGLKW